MFIDIEIGSKVIYFGKTASIIKIVDLSRVSIMELETNIVHTVKSSELEIIPKSEAANNSSRKSQYLTALTEKEWNKAKERYDIIKPILDEPGNANIVRSRAKEFGIHYTTIYRWLKIYHENSTISSLAGSTKKGGKGLSRLETEVDTIIQEVIAEHYLNSSKKSISQSYREIRKRCIKKNFEVPHENTIRNRIKSISEEELIKKRYGYQKARDLFHPHKGHFPGASFPLSVVQIDHTKLDIILVDEHYRKAFKRPWLTLAIDVFSRMVMGFYLSFDPPGELGTGLCIANSILRKETALSRYNIKGEWPCWGIMKTIHVDNAKEFKGNMLRKACENYSISLEFRPVATPHYGGHVERLLGTFSKEIHNLSGSTFSDPSLRKNYDSEAKSALTIKEFEKWFMIYIINVYHNKRHSTIKMSPLQKYTEGILGKNGNIPTGVPSFVPDERRLKLDFMPFVKRTIQEYGVLIDHITYYDDVLRRYIHATKSGSRNGKMKFIFKRDPRDISVIFFFDPELEEYFEIPYRDTSKPAISLWEYREVIRELAKRGDNIDETTIFNAFERMEEIEKQAIRATKTMRRVGRNADTRSSRKKIEIPENKDWQKSINLSLDIKPFEDLDDGTSS